jgi:hypothetical protein
VQQTEIVGQITGQIVQFGQRPMLARHIDRDACPPFPIVGNIKLKDYAPGAHATLRISL